MATEASLNLEQRATALTNAGQVIRKLADYGWKTEDLMLLVEVPAAAQDALRASKDWAKRRVTPAVNDILGAFHPRLDHGLHDRLNHLFQNRPHDTKKPYTDTRRLLSQEYKRNIVGFTLTVTARGTWTLVCRLENIDPGQYTTVKGDYYWDLWLPQGLGLLSQGLAGIPSEMAREVKAAMVRTWKT